MSSYLIGPGRGKRTNHPVNKGTLRGHWVCFSVAVALVVAHCQTYVCVRVKKRNPEKVREVCGGVGVCECNIFPAVETSAV